MHQSLANQIDSNESKEKKTTITTKIFFMMNRQRIHTMCKPRSEH